MNPDSLMYKEERALFPLNDELLPWRHTDAHTYTHAHIHVHTQDNLCIGYSDLFYFEEFVWHR